MVIRLRDLKKSVRILGIDLCANLILLKLGVQSQDLSCRMFGHVERRRSSQVFSRSCRGCRAGINIAFDNGDGGDEVVPLLSDAMHKKK
jgi:hypothetical protein